MNSEQEKESRGIPTGIPNKQWHRSGKSCPIFRSMSKLGVFHIKCVKGRDGRRKNYRSWLKPVAETAGCLHQNAFSSFFVFLTEYPYLAMYIKITHRTKAYIFLFSLADRYVQVTRLWKHSVGFWGVSLRGRGMPPNHKPTNRRQRYVRNISGIDMESKRKTMKNRLFSFTQHKIPTVSFVKNRRQRVIFMRIL